MAAINNKFVYRNFVLLCLSCDPEKAASVLTGQIYQSTLLSRIVSVLSLITHFANKEAAVLSEDCHPLTPTQFWRNCCTTHKWSVDQTLLLACLRRALRKKGLATRDYICTYIQYNI